MDIIYIAVIIDTVPFKNFTYLPKGKYEQGKLKGAQSGTLRHTTGKSSSNKCLLQLAV